MNKCEKIIARISVYMGFKRDNEFCDFFKIKPNTLSTWKKRNKIPYELCEEISQNENISFDWILTGSEKVSNKSSKCEDYDKSNYKIPLLKQKVSAGYGESSSFKIEIKEELPLHKSLFKTEPSKNILAMQVKGTSMEPTIENDSFILFNENPNFEGDDLYIIVKDSELFVKRLFIDMDGILNIVSDNKNFPSFKINKETQEYNFIVGKVKQIIPLFKS